MRPWVIMAQNYSHLLWEVTINFRNAEFTFSKRETISEDCKDGILFVQEQFWLWAFVDAHSQKAETKRMCVYALAIASSIL